MKFYENVQREMERLEVLFREAREAHVDFRRKWDEGYKKFGLRYKETKTYKESLDNHHAKVGLIYYDVMPLIEKANNGDLSGLSLLFAYLGVNIRYFRSGYMKAKICRVIKKASLSDEQKEVLMEIILKNIPFAGREINEVVRLIPLVDNEKFRKEIRSIAESNGDYVKKRIEWISKNHLSRPLNSSLAAIK